MIPKGLNIGSPSSSTRAYRNITYRIVINRQNEKQKKEKAKSRRREEGLPASVRTGHCTARCACAETSGIASSRRRRTERRECEKVRRGFRSEPTPSPRAHRRCATSDVAPMSSRSPRRHSRQTQIARDDSRASAKMWPPRRRAASYPRLIDETTFHVGRSRDCPRADSSNVRDAGLHHVRSKHERAGAVVAGEVRWVNTPAVYVPLSMTAVRRPVTPGLRSGISPDHVSFYFHCSLDVNKGYVPLFTASTANNMFSFNIRWTIKMKCYSQWITERSQR